MVTEMVTETVALTDKEQVIYTDIEQGFNEESWPSMGWIPCVFQTPKNFSFKMWLLFYCIL